MPYKQSTVDERMLTQVEGFLRTGLERGFFDSAMRKEVAREMTAWIPKMRAALNPREITEELRLKLAPLLAVFAETHERVVCLGLLLEAWGRMTGKSLAMESVTGPLWIGDDAAADERHLREWPQAFARFFPATALPPPLQPEPVKKQLAAHAAARAEMPASTPGQTYKAARSTLKTLREEGLGHWKRMHDLLDGEFGADMGAYETKAAFGYNRRLRGSGASHHKRASDAPPTTAANSEPGTGTPDSAGSPAEQSSDPKKTGS